MLLTNGADGVTKLWRKSVLGGQWLVFAGQEVLDADDDTDDDSEEEEEDEDDHGEGGENYDDDGVGVGVGDVGGKGRVGK